MFEQRGSSALLEAQVRCELANHASDLMFVCTLRSNGPLPLASKLMNR
jgi:hypothetical protein